MDDQRLTPDAATLAAKLGIEDSSLVLALEVLISRACAALGPWAGTEAAAGPPSIAAWTRLADAVMDRADEVDLSGSALPALSSLTFVQQLMVAQGQVGEDGNAKAILENGFWLGFCAAVLADPGEVAGALKELRQRGGMKRGEQLTASADTRWRDAALALARKKRSERPDISQDDLCGLIIDLIGAAPGHDTVKKTVRQWEQSGEVPRSTRNPSS